MYENIQDHLYCFDLDISTYIEEYKYVHDHIW